ncbi:DUF4400 domain-containing protein [Methylocaldum szegediense]|uniref:DUF4400 domain-containing protein n=1 Tax=Methylocaldum szegediense TaxID=73780 RepID=UPI00041B976E|nr:DUF4400 domain-containing protein [Methylocaldum szegediense]
MRRHVFLSVLIWLLEIVLVAALMSERWTQWIQDEEERMLLEYFGPEKAAELQRTAMDKFDALFVRTGIRESVYAYFIPTEAERQRSKGFEDLGRYDLFPFLESRLNVLFESLFQMVYRAVVTAAWLPFLGVAVVPFAIDGLVRRKIRQTNFAYSSPVAHRYSLYVILGIAYLLLVVWTLPVPVPPQSIPIGLFVVACALNVLLTNTQKRI